MKRWIRPLWLGVLGIVLFLGSAVWLTYQQYEAQKILGPQWHVIRVEPTGGVLIMGRAGALFFVGAIVWGIVAWAARKLPS